MTLHPFYIGIDISKAYLDIFEQSTSKHLQIENTSEAISTWLSALPDMPSLNIIFEATGRYDRKLTHALHTLKIQFSRVNPARARDFARACGHMAKTDRIDARMLADMGKCLKPDATTQRAPERDQLAALHKRRDELVDTRNKERQRLAQALAEEHASIARHISWLNVEIRMIEQKRDALLKETAELTHDNKLLRSIPGIGPVAATTLLALMPELGRASPKAIAALAGLAPFNVDSGQFRGHRQGRAQTSAKCALHGSSERSAITLSLRIICECADRERKAFQGGYDCAGQKDTHHCQRPPERQCLIQSINTVAASSAVRRQGEL